MKPRLVFSILVVFVIVVICIFKIQSMNNDTSGIDEDLLVMEDIDEYKKNRGNYEYNKLLKATLKENEALSKYLKESKAKINVSTDVLADFNQVLGQRDNFYSDVMFVVQEIQDSVFRQVIIDKITAYKSEFTHKRNQATSIEHQLEALINEQKDLNIALSILATLKTEKVKEQVLDGEKQKLKNAQPALKKSIQEGNQNLNE